MNKDIALNFAVQQGKMQKHFVVTAQAKIKSSFGV